MRAVDMETSTPCIGFMPYSVAVEVYRCADVVMVGCMAGMPHSAARATQRAACVGSVRKGIVNERADGRRGSRGCLHIKM